MVLARHPAAESALAAAAAVPLAESALSAGRPARAVEKSAAELPDPIGDDVLRGENLKAQLQPIVPNENPAPAIPHCKVEH